jgi:tetratricopeptide (TPR) repeat protein
MIRSRAVPYLICALFVLGTGLQRCLAADDVKLIIQKTRQATAYVETKDASGTAWVVDRSNRLLVTNQHVVTDNVMVYIWFPLYKDGRVVTERKAYREELGLRGKVLDTDVKRDLAVIQLKDRLPDDVGELGLASGSADSGDSLHTIGNPGASGGAMWVYTPGRVRAVFDKEWQDLEFKGMFVNWRKARVVLADSPVNPGDSGGPCVNDAGQVVAVVSHGKTLDKGRLVQAMNAHIDVSEVRTFVEQTRKLMNPKTATEYTERAKRHLEAGRLDDAVEDLSQAIKLDRKCVEAYIKRATAFYRKRDYDTAIADCSEAIRLDDNNAEAYHTRARSYYRQKENDKALADFTRTIQIDTKFASAYNNRALIYDVKKDGQRAFADYTRAIELDPRDDVARSNRADLLHSYKDYDKAIRDAEAALDINPFNTFAWKVRGWSLRDKGEIAAAINNYTQALEFVPNAVDLYLLRGAAYNRVEGQFAKALENYNKAIDLDRDYHWSYFYRGQAYEDAGRLGDAQPDFEKALRLYPQHSEKLKRYYSSMLCVVNKNDEPLKVYVQYEYQSTDGDWIWWPQDATQTFWSFKAGEAANLFDSKWKIKARRIRIQAVSATGSYTTHWNNAVWLAPEKGYLGTRQLTFTYSFGGK